MFLVMGERKKMGYERQQGGRTLTATANVCDLKYGIFLTGHSLQL
jgi:hypothetical protein